MDKQWTMQMESLRKQMIDTALGKQSLLHRDVLRLSQTLDRLIVKVQAEKLAARKRQKPTW
ncbi:aspartyl-phosphate phosphatase Spo0E family protein [Paenibacillus daejeonensis]|uniref:aspartyl-phosphate phosphatase Spo0E family protein n=1 Tax=Paenibacillus daejeonensis TaxID=135193 RepID=UPI000368B11D|nr:aspartyl-phosphate phosphatase Spo0E family protein [Paenibacillus daejeonensis]